MSTASAGFNLPAVRSIMVSTEEKGTLACAPVISSDLPSSVLLCGTLAGHSMQWHLSGEAAVEFAAVLHEAGQAATLAEARAQVEADTPRLPGMGG